MTEYTLLQVLSTNAWWNLSIFILHQFVLILHLFGSGPFQNVLYIIKLLLLIDYYWCINMLAVVESN